VTGGASGLGRALGECCAEQGMRVALLDLDGERAASQAAALASTHGVEAIGLAVDVADAASVSAAVARVDERFGHADVVISNVGVQLFGAVEALTDDEWRWVLDVNVVGSARVARGFLPLVRRSVGGILAFTTSASVLSPGSRMGAYQASKFAVWGLAETLRLELADEGIAVSVIFPSGMISRHLETSEGAQPAHLRRPIGEQADFEAMLASNPGLSAHVVTPEEAARRAIGGLLAGEPYVVTHGDLVEAVAIRNRALAAAAEVGLGGAVAT
jgi:NAD(P)-dependent dehydrogenase (short-subunit alcohol dehydrogenase family)